jgi:hypothetical protein
MLENGVNLSSGGWRLEYFLVEAGKWSKYFHQRLGTRVKHSSRGWGLEKIFQQMLGIGVNISSRGSGLE